AHPPAPRRKRRLHNVGERPARLMSIGNDEERRIGELHAQRRAVAVNSGADLRPQWNRRDQLPPRPKLGLEGSAGGSLGIRPAKRAKRPASTAARMAFAIMTGSRAFDTAVLSRAAAQPSSSASAASEAVPMPASSTTGTGDRAQSNSIRCGLEMPSP